MVVDVEYGDAVALLNFVQQNSESTDTLKESQLLQGTPIVYGTAIKDGQGARYMENNAAYGVAVEPIKANKVGRVAVAGVLACNVFCRKGWHAHAAPAFSSGKSRLESCAFGNIDILFYNATASISRSGTNDTDVNKSVSALIRIGNTTPSPTVVVEVEPSWGKGQRRLCAIKANIPVVGRSPLSVGKTNVPQQSSGWGGDIYVTNVLIDITQPGLGICVQYGDDWILASWTPAVVEIDGDTYWVASYI
jgi:hypothetical protein